VETFFPRASLDRLDVLLFLYDDQAGPAREHARAASDGGGPAGHALVLALRDRRRSSRGGTGTDRFTTSWQMAAARELTRRLLDETIDRPPRWFREGLSRYLATAEVEADVAIFGHRPNDLAWELGQGRAIPLGSLLDAGDAEFSGPWHRDYAASAWGFIHYLLDGQGGKLRPRFDALAAALRRPGGSGDGRAAVAAAFPDLPFATLETQVRDYEVEMLGRRATFHPFPVSLRPPAATSATSSDPRRVQALLLGMHHH
jgi:hypothetical protein